MAYRKTEKRIQHSNEIRTLLLNTARIIIEKDGLNSLTIRRIVQNASTSTGNFYFYFKDKNDVIGILIDDELSLISSEIDAAAKRALNIGASKTGILASMVYMGMRIGLSPDRKAGLLFQQDIRKLAFPRLEKLMIERTGHFFDSAENMAENLPSEIAAVLWQGSLLLMIERGGVKGFNAEDIAEFCTIWNLRAIGTDNSEITTALALARQVWKELKN